MASDNSGAPANPPSTEKTTYQSRMGVSPTSNGNIAFSSTTEGPMHSMDRGAHVMGYTGINGGEPSAMEKGKAPPSQTSSSKGPSR
jgi:hypothetical protein